jgi:translation initiation factor 3 subunit D
MALTHSQFGALSLKGMPACFHFVDAFLQRPSWLLKEEIPLLSLTKLACDVPKGETLVEAGHIGVYNKEFDKITTRAPRRLKRFEDTQFFMVSTTDDPTIRELAASNAGNVYATDAVLAQLMSATRAVYGWDIVVQRVGSMIFLDKRETSILDYQTVNETAEQPSSDDRITINSPLPLAQEATVIYQNFSQQVLLRSIPPVDLERPSPFGTSGATVGYRYRRWDLGSGIKLVARTEVDAVTGTSASAQSLTVRALNEWDPRATLYRSKLDSQRSAVLALELKNNTAKLAKWTAQALLADTDKMKIAFVSRRNPMDALSHEVLGMSEYGPEEFASSIQLSQRNMWGIVKAVIELCQKLPEGTYSLLKDPYKPAIRIFAVPADTFEDESSDEEAAAPTDAWSK